MSFETSSAPEPPTSPPPISYRGATNRRVHTNPADKSGRVLKCTACGRTGHCFFKCNRPDKYEHRRKYTSNLQKQIENRSDRPYKRTWHEVSAYLTQKLEVSNSDSSPLADNFLDHIDPEYSQSIAQSDNGSVSSSNLICPMVPLMFTHTSL